MYISRVSLLLVLTAERILYHAIHHVRWTCRDEFIVVSPLFYRPPIDQLNHAGGVPGGAGGLGGPGPIIGGGGGGFGPPGGVTCPPSRLAAND